MKKIASAIATILLASSVLLLSACATPDADSAYSASTEGGAGTYLLGGTLVNTKGSPVVTVYRTGYHVEVSVLVSSGDDISDAPKQLYSGWSGETLQSKDNKSIGLLSNDQLASLRCVLKAEQPFHINFKAATKSMRDTYRIGNEIAPSRNKNDRGVVINPDCSVELLKKASIDEVYLTEVNVPM